MSTYRVQALVIVSMVVKADTMDEARAAWEKCEKYISSPDPQIGSGFQLNDSFVTFDTSGHIPTITKLAVPTKELI